MTIGNCFRVVLLYIVALSYGTAQAALIVDFGLTGAPVAAGATNGNVANNTGAGSAVPVTTVNLVGLPSDFGSINVQGVLSMASGSVPTSTFRAVNRTPGAKTAVQNPGLNNNTSNDDLYRDWIAITQFSQTVNDVIVEDPSPTLTFTISGLAPGQYQWTSWHHDIEDQTGLIDYTFTDAAGSSSGVIDASHGQIASSLSNMGSPPNNVNGRGNLVNGTGNPIFFPPGTPTSFSRPFTVDGSGSFTFAMSSGFNPNLMSPLSNPPYTAGSLNFAIINGFEIAQVPEPNSLALLGALGFIGLCTSKNRRK
jgi:hypothetical protein